VLAGAVGTVLAGAVGTVLAGAVGAVPSGTATFACRALVAAVSATVQPPMFDDDRSLMSVELYDRYRT
jgi:hypothetical protein